MTWFRNRVLPALLALTSLPFGASLARAEPRMPTHVACVGDSITFGLDASSNATTYPVVLQGLLGDKVQVKNFGHSSTTMLSAGYGDYPYVNVPEYQDATNFVSNAGPGALVDVIIMLGANDSKPSNWTPAGKPKNDQQYLIDYRTMVAHFSALTPKPVIYLALPLATGNAPCCQISGTVIHDEEIPLIKQLAQEQKLPVIDVNTPTSGHPEYFTDGVHPNDAGYALTAQIMRDGLLRVPTIVLTAPNPGALLDAAQPIVLSADASGGTVSIDSVEFFQGTISLGKVTSAPFTVSWAAGAGSYGLSAKAIDSTLASATTGTTPITVTSQGGAAGSGGVGGMAGASATAGARTAGSGGSSGSTGTTAGGNAGAAGGTGSAGMPGIAGTTGKTADSGGCGCAVPGSNQSGRLDVLFSALLAWVAIGTRRRSSRRQ
jgi:lysophospholipase L1-like esterase